MICVTGEIINIVLVSQVSWLIKNFNIGIFPDTINILFKNYVV